MKGNYIVIEGLEGSGKTTISHVVADTLKNLGLKKIVLVREPGGTPLAEELRKLVLEIKSTNNEIINNKTELLIFYAARVQLVENIIKPALEKGNWVIGDRHDLSTQAYQGGGRGINKKILSTLFDIILGSFRPRLTFYLDVIPEIGLTRIHSRGRLNRIERESLEFFNRIRARYLKLAEQDDTICIVDAMKPLEEVIYTVRHAVHSLVLETSI